MYIKRLLSAILTAVMVISSANIVLADNNVIPTSESSADMIYYYDVDGGSIFYDKSTGTITDCDVSVISAVIPDTIDGVKVTSIQGGAFAGCGGLKEITISTGVTALEGSVFWGCSSLASITIPAGVTSIEDNTFYDIDKFTIYCSSGSYAEKYAKEHYINYVLK